MYLHNAKKVFYLHNGFYRCATRVKIGKIAGQRIRIFDDSDFDVDDYLLIDVKKDIKDACLSINTFEEHRKIIPPKDYHEYGYVETYYYGTALTTREPGKAKETWDNLLKWFRINTEQLNGKVSFRFQESCL